MSVSGGWPVDKSTALRVIQPVAIRHTLRYLKRANKPETMMHQLDGCPFCEGEAFLSNYIVEAAVTCALCGATMTRQHTSSGDTGIAEVVEAWNRRTLTAQAFTANAKGAALASAAIEALRPFAEKLVDIGTDEADNDTFREMSPEHRRAPPITVGHMRAAAEIIKLAEPETR